MIDSTTGKIYFCGTFRFVNGQPRKAIVRCNADGTVDSSFVPTGLIGGSTALAGRAMVLQTGGKVVLGGTRLRTAAGGTTYYELLRFNADGTLDPTFTLVPTTNSSAILAPAIFTRCRAGTFSPATSACFAFYRTGRWILLSRHSIIRRRTLTRIPGKPLPFGLTSMVIPARRIWQIKVALYTRLGGVPCGQYYEAYPRRNDRCTI